MRNDGDGPTTRLLCGGSVLSDTSATLTAMLPDVLHVGTSTMFATTWLEPVLLALDAEATLDQPGAVAIKEKVADVFVAQALRSWMIAAGDAGWRAPLTLADARLDRVLAAMRNRCGEKWTLDQLASLAGLSRTAFTTRFRRAVGETPMRHLTRVRLANAAGHLATDDRSRYEIALLTGYETDAALSKAFRREFDVSPGSYRRTSRQRPRVSDQLDCAPESGRTPEGSVTGDQCEPQGFRESHIHGVVNREVGTQLPDAREQRTMRVQSKR